MYCLTAFKTLLWPTRSPDLSPIQHVGDRMRRRRHLPENVDDLARQFEQIWQEISQETIRVFYHAIPHRVVAFNTARGGSTPC
ncbi:hypothetical protein TNCV_710371 [Trichonephila clavipes]|uniref:Uncharacterized protein n=1 Tax=Trichonephila clavipes TaxID=2585209 RepID=A0A8X6RNV0_TRICX|nr:hypothetical protein TNCV_710371 [Trichonephila clavipes]